MLGGTIFAVLLLTVGQQLSTNQASKNPQVHLLRIDEKSPGAERRLERLVARLSQVPRLHYAVSTVEANIHDLNDLRATLQSVPDRSQDIVLAGSGVMAVAAAEHFRNASILFASQHDPWEIGLMSVDSRANPSMTGFTFDFNVVPQLLSILERSNLSVRRVAIVADQYMAGPWTKRAVEMHRQYPAYDFRVLRVDNDLELERCFAQPEADDVDAWILLATATNLRRFKSIVAELERRKKIGVYPTRSDVIAGGLMAYETRDADPYGIWTRQIVLLSQGVPASEIPVEHTSGFELAINLAAADRIGVHFPPSIIKSASAVVFEPNP